MSYDVALEVTKYLKKETHYVPLKAAFNNFQTLETSLRGSNTTFHEYIYEILDNLYKDLGMGDIPADSHLRKLLRYDVAYYACRFGQLQCIETAYAILQYGTTSPDIQPAVFCGAVQHTNGARAAFESLIHRLNFITATESDKAENSREIGSIIEAIQCLKTPELQESALDIVRYGLNDLERSHRIDIFVAVASGSYDGLVRSVVYLRNNYRNIELELGSLEAVFNALGTHIHTEELEATV